MIGKINLEALHYYLSYRHVPSPLSIIEGQYKPALIDFSHLKFAPLHTLSEEAIIDKIDDFLQKTIKKNLDNHVGILTSGGIDSGIVTAMAAKISPSRIQTFTLTYAEEDETEGKRTDREYARWISQIYKTVHREMVISFKDFPLWLPDILKHIGEPFAGYVSPYFIARFVKQYVDKVFTGDLPDELFGSYKAHRLAYQRLSDKPWQIRYELLVFNDEEKQSLYDKEVYKLVQKYSTLEHLKRYCSNFTAEEPFNKMLEMEFRSFYPDHTFMSFNKLTKAHSLEAFSPYSTEAFMQFAAKIPSELKIKGGETKYILKQLATRYLPKEIVYRKKEGFVTPTLSLVRRLEKYIRQTLSPAHLEKHNLFNVDYVQNLLDEFYANGKEEQAYKIWTLVSFQVWYETAWQTKKE